jgi:hypothetical protein
MEANVSCSETLAPREAEKIAELVRLFKLVADEHGWRPGSQLDAYAGRSAYFAAYAGGALAGGLQLELADCTGTWSFQSVWPEVAPEDNGSFAYVSMLALAKEHRGDPLLFWMPCARMWRHCRENGIESLWIAATPATLAAYRRLGWPLEVCGSLRPHWGEDCYLTSMTVEGVAESLERRAARSPRYREIVAAMRAGAREAPPLAIPAAA